jgi:hypothetical protein
MLTNAECANACCPPERKQARFRDSGGLYLQVSPNGSKRWFLKYRTGGKEKQLALGSYPTVGLKEARLARDAAKLQKAEGQDPITARQVEKLKAAVGAGDTLEAVAREWLERNRPNWSASHYEREQRNIEKDLLPWLGKRSIKDIEPVELLAVIQKVADRGALSVVERVHLTAHGVWCHAVATGRAPRDITGDIRKALPVHLRKNYPAIVEPAALGELLRAMDGYKGGPVVRAALQLVPILFQRPAFFMPIPRRSLRTMPVLATGGGWPSSRPQVQQHAGHGQVT